MKNYQEILVECWYDQVDLESIKKWAYSYIENNDDIPEEIFELLDADKYQFEGLLLKLSKAIDSDFSPQSISAEILAAKHLIKVATKYLNDEITKMERSEEHTSELQSPVPISYAVFCLKKKKTYKLAYSYCTGIMSIDREVVVLHREATASTSICAVTTNVTWE